MSLLARAKFSAGKRLFSRHPITALQQFDFYSTRTTETSPKTPRLPTPRTQKSSEPSTSFSQRIKNQAGPLTVWPKPIEIPYQAKVSNFVNLIGHITGPVRLEASSDGNLFAAAVIFQEYGEGKNSLLIPVLFEGDLAHVVASHVKENDCVFVSGQLSVDPTRFASNDSLGKFRFHVVVENLNFVQGFKRKVSGKKLDVSFQTAEIEKPATRKIEEVVERVDNDEDFSQQWKAALEHAKVKAISGENDWASLSTVIPCMDADCDATSERVVSKPEKGNEKKKDGDVTLDLWRDLLENPLQWWDYRDHKSNGLVKEKFPDFKQKGTGDSLWVNRAPDWVLTGLEKLEFDVKVMKAKPVQGGEGPGERKNVGKGDDYWKNLVENPNKWWDNRLGKRNPKAPDFKNKETGEGLWVSNSPDWALSRLPPLKDGQNTVQKYAQTV